MAQPNENRVTVHVTVVVEGGQAGVVMEAAPKIVPPRQLFRAIDYPLSGQDTPVTACSGMYCTPAHGTAPLSSGTSQYPYTAWALAYPSTSVIPTQHPQPDPGAVSTLVNRSTGAWNFSQVPGAKCEAKPAGIDNSTLMVWYDYNPPSSGPPHFANTDLITFPGKCPASGGGVPLLAYAIHPSETLYATFTGKLASLGTVTLKWNGAGWVGHSSGERAAVFSFLDYAGTFQLLGTGPGTAFVVAGRPRAARPFSWTAHGEAFGPLAGVFEVTIVE